MDWKRSIATFRPPNLQRSTNVQSKVTNSWPAIELDEDTFEFANAVFDLARAGASQTLGALLGRGLPPNLRNHRGDSLLMLAAYHGHLETVRMLLRHHSDPDLRNGNGQTPLAGAACKGDLPMIKLLLAYGADIEGASPDGRTALMLAAMFNRTRIVEYLVNCGANLHAADASGVSAADVAQRMDASKAVALLQELKSASLSTPGSTHVRPPLAN
jgi:ankyrin repeat protein